MSIQTSAGTEISIGTTAASSAADIFALIGEVTDLGDFGRVYDEIKHKPLNTRATKKAKGGFDDGSVQIQLALDLEDEGQQAVETALDDDGSFNIRIELPNPKTQGGHGTYIEFKAKVLGFTYKFGNSSAVVGRTLTLSIDGKISRTAAT